MIAGSMGKRQIVGGSVMLQTMFWWETLGPGIHADVNLTRSTYEDIAANNLPPFKEMVFLDGSGLFQQDNEPCLTAKVVQEWLEAFKVLPWPPNCPDLNLIEHLWDVLEH
ncbi:hypothetical protein JRQ81_016607 [Phrynocephalus forsythii]|uniref:Tc1-like transposase DDE domain-containing protein n=1 Tax=Phrynocephalus forsythii TaxID=171643 RepID=A0A9Q0XT75_9SAUR|nr:hypothetical protein JRQ81_016607 [Phrynocephalus forsythii]